MNRHAITMADHIDNGTIAVVDGIQRVYYDGYWIRYYAPPEETLAAKKKLIDALTRRTFHHTESGINTPGEYLGAARTAYQVESDPARKRVKGAMLAGALFNRATDIFTTIVAMEERGLKISRGNELMRECSCCFQEALTFGKMVKHYSGEEGVDELWGEPLKVFTTPTANFYVSRYIKIAQTMRDINKITDRICAVLGRLKPFAGIDVRLQAFAEAAALESETMKSDPVNLEIWPQFVASSEALAAFTPDLTGIDDDRSRCHLAAGQQLASDGRRLISWLAGVRVPMPKSTRDFLARCDDYRARSEALSLT